jgi:hypothetical protein
LQNWAKLQNCKTGDRPQFYWIISQQGYGLLYPLDDHLGCLGIVLVYELRLIIQVFNALGSHLFCFVEIY